MPNLREKVSDFEEVKKRKRKEKKIPLSHTLIERL